MSRLRGAIKDDKLSTFHLSVPVSGPYPTFSRPDITVMFDWALKTNFHSRFQDILKLLKRPCTDMLSYYYSDKKSKET